jgi:hypothetical protein
VAGVVVVVEVMEADWEVVLQEVGWMAERVGAGMVMVLVLVVASSREGVVVAAVNSPLLGTAGGKHM